MKMTRLFTISFAIILFFATLIPASLKAAATTPTKSYEVTSPDGTLVMRINTGETLSYELFHRGLQACDQQSSAVHDTPQPCVHDAPQTSPQVSPIASVQALPQVPLVTVLGKSVIALNLADGTVYGGTAKPQKVTRRSVNTTVHAQGYFRSEIVDNYNELTLAFRDFLLVVRAYNQGVAYRFVTRSKKDFCVANETAQFAFPEGTKAWIPYVRKKYKDDMSPAEKRERQFFNSFENTYTVSTITEWDQERLAFLPVLFEITPDSQALTSGVHDTPQASSQVSAPAPASLKVCITEADLIAYPGMYLANTDGDNTLEAVFAPVPDETEQGGHNNLQRLVKTRKPYIAQCTPQTVFPWRVISVAASDEELLENDLVYLLATPAKACPSPTAADRSAKPAAQPAADWSWVKPGKVAWDWWSEWNLKGVDFVTGINNETYKYYIDFAAENGIEYVILDEGWAVKYKADLLQVIPEIDLPYLVKYAADKGIGIILWAGYYAFNRDMENVCRYYSALGVKGFKVDFMDAADQDMVAFHYKAAETAAKYHLILDFHGTYKPTGLHRTFPNVVNYEGVHGLEQMKWAKPNVDQVTYDLQIPFIRMLAGPMDYTQGAMRNAIKKHYHPVYGEPMSQGTRTRQLAEYMIFFAPFSMLCDSPSNYLAEKECTEFIATVPTVWDETVALPSKVGKWVAIARRSGNKWYIGVINDWSTRTLDLDLTRLSLSKDAALTTFSDGPNAHRVASDYKKTTTTLDDPQTLHITLAPGGGFVAIIE